MSLLSVILCLVQMTGLLLLAGLIARILRPSSPAQAANVAAAGLLLSLSLVVISLADLPRPLTTQINTSLSSLFQPPATLSSAAQTSTAPADTPPTDSDMDRPLRVTDGPQASASLTEIVGLLGSTRITPLNDHTVMNPPLAVFLLLIVVVGIAPAMVGLMATAQLHRRSRPVSDLDQAQLNGLISGRRERNICFRTSGLTNAPCVTLIGCQTIYLPPDWKNWSDHELCAAVAHEVAHLNRRDPFIRLMTQIASSAQRFHPLAIWLHQSVILSQEMAADRNAAEQNAAEQRNPNDNQPNYAATLSRIALRLDTQIQPHGSKIMGWILGTGTVSVSSSHLIRRIEMLTRPKTRMTPLRRHLTGGIAMLSVIGIWILSAGWTVRAQPPNPATEQSDASAPRVARLPSSSPAKNGPISKSIASSPASRPWDDLQENDSGYAVVHVDALLNKVPMLQHLVLATLEPQVDNAWQAITSPDSETDRRSMGLAIANLRTIATGLNFSMSKKPPKEGQEKTSSMTIGANNGKIWFREPVAHDPLARALDVDRIAQILAESGTSVEDLKGQSFLEFTQTMLDSILTEGATTDSLGFSPKKEPESHDSTQLEKLKRAWAAVDGGEVTACFSLPDRLGHVADQDDELTDSVLRHTACMAIGLNFDSQQPITANIALIPRRGITEADLNALAESLEQRIERKIDAMVEGGESVVKTQLAKRIFDTRVIRPADASDRKSGNAVLIEIRIPIESLALLII